MTQSRRQFLQKVSAAAAAGVVAPRLFPGRWLDAMPATTLIGEHADYDEAELKALAQHALDAARSAGAKFSDVRINVGRALVYASFDGRVTDTTLITQATVGVRAIAENTWGFAGGGTLTKDAVASAARLAVARSRAGQPRHARQLELAPTPVVPNGHWKTPIEKDPFDIPIGEHEAIYIDAMAEAQKVKGVRNIGGLTGWLRWDRVFASTEGSVTVQRIYTAAPSGTVYASPAGEDSFWVGQTAPGLRVGGYGY